MLIGPEQLLHVQTLCIPMMIWVKCQNQLGSIQHKMHENKRSYMQKREKDQNNLLFNNCVLHSFTTVYMLVTFALIDYATKILPW